MSDIEQATQRITTALERVEKVLNSDKVGNAKQSEELDAVKAELSALQATHSDVQSKFSENEEKLSETQRKLDRATEECADLEGKLKFVRQKAWKFRKWSQDKNAEHKKTIEELDQKLQALGEVNRALRENNRKLREANAEGLPDAELINTGLQAELESVRAHRDVEIAEFGAAHSTLKSLLESLEFEADKEDLMDDDMVLDQLDGDEGKVNDTKEEDA